MRIGGVALKPGNYVFGYTHVNDVLRVHFNEAATGTLLGTTDAHLITGTKGITSLRIWPPGTRGAGPDRAVLHAVRTGRRVRQSPKRDWE